MIDLQLSLEMGIGLVAIAVAVYSLLAGSLARHSVSAAFAFVVIGALMGGAGVGLVTDAILDVTTLGLLTEVTLALVLFSSASTVRIAKLEGDTRAVLRLLAIGLPLTIAAGTLLALGLFPGISLGLALLLGASLAPTDADLGQQVITDRSVPARIRRLLNVESGMNDGIAAPVVSVGIAMAVVGEVSAAEAIVEAIAELAVAAVIGVALGAGGRWLLLRADLRGLTSASARKLFVLALAVAAFFIADGFGASGFIAAFFAGLAFGVGSKERVEQAVAFTEAQSVLLSIIVWLIFGLIIVDAHVFGSFDPVVVLYAILSLTLLRMIPVAIALMGVRFDRASVIFMGWFGPRGLASIVFALLALESLEAAAVDTGPLLPVVAWTVLLSVILHGFSARPLAGWYARHTQHLPDDSPEFIGETEPHAKGSMWSIHYHPERDSRP